MRSETHESAAYMDVVQAREGSNPHPPCFKVLSQRVEKFSGRSGENDFDVWLLDFIEASADCGCRMSRGLGGFLGSYIWSC